MRVRRLLAIPVLFLFVLLLAYFGYRQYLQESTIEVVFPEVNMGQFDGDAWKERATRPGVIRAILQLSDPPAGGSITVRGRRHRRSVVTCLKANPQAEIRSRS